MDFLMSIWNFFATNILTQPAYFIGLMVFVGYMLLRKPLYDALAGFIKATVGYMILAVGSGGLTNNFRPILVGLKDRFNLDAMVIDPYFGQNAVTAGIGEQFGRTFSGNVIVTSCIYHEPCIGSFKEMDKNACCIYNRSRTDAAGIYSILADSVLFPKTWRYSDSDRYGLDPWFILGSWF